MLKERSLESPQSKTPSSRASSKSYPLPTPNRRDRRLEFGIDMLDTVVFGHWYLRCVILGSLVESM
jgi:hypothetical protein